jgi:excisionase family DNA binding protein
MIQQDATQLIVPSIVNASLTKSGAMLRIVLLGQTAMVYLSLREAAQRTGTSKSTILRAIQRGRMSAKKNDIGGYDIDPAELFRVFPADRKTGSAQQSGNDATGQAATGIETANATGETVALQAQLAALEAQITALKELSSEYKSQRDAWQQQAERLALQHSGESPKPTGWWRRLTG